MISPRNDRCIHRLLIYRISCFAPGTDLVAQDAADAGDQPGVGLGVAPHVGCVAAAATPLGRASLPAVKEPVRRPATRHRVENCHLRTDPIQQPIRQIRGVQCAVVQACLLGQIVEVGGDVAGNAQRVRPPVGVHIALVVRHLADVRKVPRQDERDGPLLTGLENEG